MCNSCLLLDIDSIKMFNFIRNTNLPRKAYAQLAKFWGSRIHVESLYKLFRHILELSNIETTVYDCCINSCCAFTGTDYKTAELCPYCHEPRFDKHCRSRNTFEYIPLTSRIKSMFLNCSLTERMTYRSNFEFNAGCYDDVFSGSHYQHLTSEYVVVDGVRHPHLFFSDSHDIALGILTDCHIHPQLSTSGPSDPSSLPPLLLH
ncbi:uncharacterized protein EI90DRAFT_2948271 [Cantharellus anzutake]|uniref:uncharacterized protein n=1 Tax=Cantharellus anzutake TaxID=1750568 RepID=UPI001905A06A|nr:uncharacterized protein EI90DRAFT_2948271 [Cantharellus anzutake]KAF8314411.1 hypothetical protein EI90DRAFT_2948271 [Cantharellus anzutake]